MNRYISMLLVHRFRIITIITIKAVDVVMVRIEVGVKLTRTKINISLGKRVAMPITNS